MMINFDEIRREIMKLLSEIFTADFDVLTTDHIPKGTHTHKTST